MIKIGITGNIASGKSFVESYLQEKGYLVYDADEIVHQLFEKNAIIEELKKVFSDKILQNNKVNRNILGQIVFKNKIKLKKLEKIIHPEVKQKILDLFDKHNKEPVVFVSVPLMYEANFQDLFDYVIFIKIDEKIQLERLMNRNNYSKNEAKLRINSQMKQSEKVMQADFVIDNSISYQETIFQIKNLLVKLDIK